MNKIRDYAVRFFTEGHIRSIEAKKNIAAEIAIKGMSIAISLVMVPITLHYVNPTQYGIWLTLSSMVAWISFFDIGLSNGLRNKFAEAKANGNTELARSYVSTTYFYLSGIFGSLLVLFLIINQFVNWTKLLNLSEIETGNVSLLAIIVFSYFSITFVLRIVTVVLTADQKPAITALINVLGQLLGLIIIYVLTKTTTGSLINLAIPFCVAPVIVFLISNLYFFNTKYKSYAPSYKFVKKEHAKDIMGLGVKFFVIQIAGIIQYQTANFLIANYFGMKEVTAYNIAYRYFSVLNMGFSILLNPFWSAVTEAYFKKDYEWIKNSVKKYKLAWIGFSLIGIIMLLISNWVYELWLGKGTIDISFELSFWSFIFVFTKMFSEIYVLALNGINALKIQFYLCFITPFIFILSSIFMIKFLNWGISSILIGSILSNISGYIVAPTQYHMVFNKGKKGIWLQ